MARNVKRLTALKVERIKERGYYADGDGLWLQVTPSTSKSWVFRFMLNGRAREMGLGPLRRVSLAEARTKAAECRNMLLAGIDPIEARKSARAEANVETAKSFTFDECADAYIAAHRASWKNPKHIDQWTNTIRTYASPVFGTMPVASVDTGLLMKCLDSIWSTKTETASRLRGRIESVLDWATVRGYRIGENPARWKGHLDHLLPARAKVQKVEHHPALPYMQISAFMKALRAQDGIAARALEFAILTAARTGETIGAKWCEIDFAEKVWAVPLERMKAKREHRVPLCERSMTILTELEHLRQGEFVFPGRREGAALSNMAMLQLLERMERGDLTVHGFRSTFRDWAAELTAYPREVAEMALAHSIGDKVEAAYRRGDLFEKRRHLMHDWAAYCDRAPEQLAEVTFINDAKTKRKNRA